MSKHEPLPLTDLKQLREVIQSAKIIHREKLSRLDRVAIFATEKIGSMPFFLFLAAWTVLWVGWNTFAPVGLRFDPYPAFVLWLFISNIAQLMIMPLLLVGQNILSAHSEARAEAEFQLDIKAEREIEAIIQHLENQNEVLADIRGRLEKLRPE
jgi:uncharacterized membrane protein